MCVNVDDLDLNIMYNKIKTLDLFSNWNGCYDYNCDQEYYYQCPYTFDD